jgi:gamma-glutamyltranspeptidase/glutathione hydrolase
MVRLPALSRTLRLIAEEGASVAYEGAVGRRTAAYLEAAGCPIRTDDLAAHRSDWGEPVALGYRGVTCLSHPPNSVGVIALQTLGILDRFPAPAAAAFDGDGCHDARWVHLGLEASRLALAERDATIADPERTAPGAVEALLSAERLDDLAGHLDPDARLEPSRTALPRGGGTVHLATADAGGGLVSMLESNYLGFGSGLVDPETGIAFQNRGSFFSLDPTHPNALAPATRTLHTLTPGLLVRDGRPWIAHGSMGGEIQPQVFAQFVSAIVDGGLDIATAIAAPRWAALMEAHRGAPSTSALEEGYDDAVAEGLASRGHRVLRVERWAAVMGHANAVEVVRASDGEVETTFAAASDPRSEGLPGAC